MTNEIVLEIEPLSETQVVIDSIRKPVDITKEYKVVVLYSENQNRYLPIWVGPVEAEVLVSELTNIPHQTTTAFIEQINLSGKPIKISITDLINQVYKASITVEKSGNEIHLPMRPSDVLAVAVRLDLPIIVSNAVMNEAAKSPPVTGIMAGINNAFNALKTKFRIRPTK
ncbi:MAG: bifunctional nuclease family protein [Chloroflexi bacterium]|nr:bifunctional nuclease family protein [Chloroflexota bacterium]MCC6896233.1 bifunctional nuclease family protein [Anaerolineae bacterium]